MVLYIQRIIIYIGGKFVYNIYVESIMALYVKNIILCQKFIKNAHCKNKNARNYCAVPNKALVSPCNRL